jgi:uncharacterized protein (TIGR02118 family)
VPTTITVIYDNPEDPAAFEATFPDQLALAHELPGVQKVVSAKVWPKEDGTPPPAYRMLDLRFADYAAASAAVTTAQAGAFFPAVVDAATGGVRIVFADVEET